MMKRRTKITILVAALVVSVALLNVGFAAWVLSNNSVGYHEGNISVEAVADKSITLKVDESVDSIHFGKPKDIAPNTWLAPLSGTEDENLTTKIKITASKNIPDINVYFSATKSGDESNNYSRAVELNLITLPTYTVLDESGETSHYFEIVPTDSFGLTLQRTEYERPTDPEDPLGQELFTVYLNIELKWGSHFGGVNPYTYYMNKGYDEEIANAYERVFGSDGENIIDIQPVDTAPANEDAFSALWKLNDLMDDLSYKYIFKAKSSK